MNKDDHPNDLDRLEQLLRDSATVPVADDGFTDAVMKNLPRRRPPSSLSILIALILGVALPSWQLSDSPLLSQLTQELYSGQFSTISLTVLAAVMITAFCSSAGVMTK